jgi:hypothetical protein
VEAGGHPRSAGDRCMGPVSPSTTILSRPPQPCDAPRPPGLLSLGMNISKLDAARRQSESAIRLFSFHGDPVAIHTLAGAARTLLRELARAEGHEAGLDAVVQETIRPEKVEEVNGLFVQAQNFFKHADRDHDQLFDFNPTTTEFLLWDICLLYETLTSHRLPILTVFRTWFYLAHPHLLSPEVREQVLNIPSQFDPNDRPGFFREMLPAAEEP